MPPSLPMTPPAATQIGGDLSMQTCKDWTTYFANLVPIDRHSAEDVRARQCRMARLHLLSGIRQEDVAHAFEVSLSTVTRSVRLYRERGEEGFRQPRRGRGRVVLNAGRVREAEALLAGGMSGSASARRLGIPVSTFNENRRAGVIGGGGGKTRGSSRSERDSRDREAPMGRATHDVAGRVLAMTGQMEEARPTFGEPAHGVAGGGVLAGLPMLLREGLLGAASRLLGLPNGFYGVASVLLFVAFLALARVRNAESLRYQAPGEWGILLGLDRCPEVKTLRRKIRLMAGRDGAVHAWQDALARQRMAEDPEACATLAVDGHVKTYSGRKGKLPKHFVARQKLFLPASVSYWVNALGGSPLLCLHKGLDPKMVKALEGDIVPQLAALGVLPADAPDLTVPEPGKPALTLVFDREGWSPALFRRLAQRGIAVITWHKGFKGEDWPAAAFHRLAVPVFGPAGSGETQATLAEQRIELRNGFEVRQIRRLLDNGRQPALITTHPQLPMAQAAGALFSRWSQENFFKYMRQEFNLDASPTHVLKPADPEARVVNPVRREVEKVIRRLRSRIAGMHGRIARARKPREREKRQAELAELDREIEDLKATRKSLPTHIRVADLPEGEALHMLPVEERLLLDIIRMIAYRAETRMMQPLVTGPGKGRSARKLLRALLTSDADVIPEPEAGILRVRFLGLGSDACEQNLAPLINELNQTRTRYPGTDLTIFYELPLSQPEQIVKQIGGGPDV